MNTQQVEAYLDRIGYTGSRELTGETLDKLIWAHISTVPFESLDLHEYGIVPSLNEDDLYNKFVVRRRGGYCFEQNTIFGALLRDLGFPVYGVCVRLLGRPGPLRAFSHKGLVVHAEGKDWYCDVGYGGPGPKGVVEMREGEQVVGGLTYRGSFTKREGNFSIERLDPDGWKDVLFFAPRPIEQVDFDPLNFYIALRPDSGFRLNRTVNLTLPNGSKALSGSHYTHRENGQIVCEKDVTTREELHDLLLSEFGIEMYVPSTAKI